MGKRGPQPSGIVTKQIRLDEKLVEAIRRLSRENGKSQSEVVDRAMRVYAATLAFIRADNQLQSTELYQRLEELLK